MWILSSQYHLSQLATGHALGKCDCAHLMPSNDFERRFAIRIYPETATKSSSGAFSGGHALRLARIVERCQPHQPSLSDTRNVPNSQEAKVLVQYCKGAPWLGHLRLVAECERSRVLAARKRSVSAYWEGKFNPLTEMVNSMSSLSRPGLRQGTNRRSAGGASSPGASAMKLRPAPFPVLHTIFLLRYEYVGSTPGRKWYWPWCDVPRIDGTPEELCVALQIPDPGSD